MDRVLACRFPGSGAARGAEQTFDCVVHRGVAPAAYDFAVAHDTQPGVGQGGLEVTRRREGVRGVVGCLSGWDERAHGLVHHRPLRSLWLREQTGHDAAAGAYDAGRFTQRPPRVASELERVDPEHRVECGVAARSMAGVPGVQSAEGGITVPRATLQLIMM